MKKIIMLVFVLLSCNASAGLITANISLEQLSVGERLEISLEASDFVESDNFWFDLTFDTSILAFDPASLLSDLSLVNSNAGLFDGLEVTQESFGLGFLFSDFTNTASGSFNIARFQLAAIDNGSSLFDLAALDGLGTNAPITFEVAFTSTDKVTVASASVPEPATIMLMLFSLLFVVNRSRR